MNSQICGGQPGCETITDLCAKYPELMKFGIYRKLNDGKVEFVSYCDALITDFQSISSSDLNRLLDAYKK